MGWCSLRLITALGWLQSFRVLSEVPFSRGVAQQIVSTVNLTRYALISADADYRPDLLHILAYQEGVPYYFPSLQRTFATISIEDYWNGINNIEVFSRLD